METIVSAVVADLTVDEFQIIIDKAELVRSIVTQANITHLPWFAQALYKLYMVNNHMDFLLHGGAKVSQNEALHVAMTCHNVDEGYLRMAEGNLNMYVEMDPPMEPRDPTTMQTPSWVSLPFIKPTGEGWSHGDPDVTQASDLRWHYCMDLKGHEEDWQVQLHESWRQQRNMNGADAKAIYMCRCAQPHYNYTRGFWMCTECSRDSNW